MSKRKLPIEAYDPRYLQLWLRASREVIVIGEIDTTNPAWEAATRLLTKFNVEANEVRARAKELKHPGWEDLYRASMKMRKHRGKIVYLECSPRSEELEGLFANIGAMRPIAARSAGVRTVPEILTVPEDILEGLFPDGPTEPKGSVPQEKRDLTQKPLDNTGP
jgi:hypothetical protein